MKNKKGISPLIATVLIIGFTIVLAALVITWGTRLFQTTVSSTETLSKFNVLCSTGVDFEATAKLTKDVNGNVQNSGKDITMTLTNKKDQKISGFYFITKKSDDSSSEAYITDDNVIPGTQKAQSIAANNAFTGFITPAQGELSAFATNSNIGLRAASESKTKVEVRPIVAIDTGEKKVCENSKTITVA